MTQFFEISEHGGPRRIAYEKRDGSEPAIVWLGGFRSDMRGTKAEALDAYAAATGRAFLRFDYAGHGESGGDFEACGISTWLADALAAIRLTSGRPILVGSSMGGWIALLATRALRATDPDRAPAGLVLIAPAVDFTERLMWERFPDEVRRTIESIGVYRRPSEYDPAGYPITRHLIEDGRRHLMFGGSIDTGCPVHILQGMRDPDVHWQHALDTIERLPGESVALTLIKDGDHRLSREEDLARLVAAVSAIA